MRPDRCPKCQSGFTDIRHVIFPKEDHTRSYQCDDSWHKPGYDPDILVLTDDDRKMLKENLIGV